MRFLACCLFSRASREAFLSSSLPHSLQRTLCSGDQPNVPFPPDGRWPGSLTVSNHLWGVRQRRTFLGDRPSPSPCSVHSAHGIGFPDPPCDGHHAQRTEAGPRTHIAQLGTPGTEICGPPSFTPQPPLQCKFGSECGQGPLCPLPSERTRAQGTVWAAGDTQALRHVADSLHNMTSCGRSQCGDRRHANENSL